MKRIESRIAILSRHPGVAFNYAKLFNDLDCYAISIFNTLKKLSQRVRDGERYHMLVLGEFELEGGSKEIQRIAKRKGVKSVLLITDADFARRRMITNWASQAKFPLLRLLQAPLRASELKEIIDLACDIEANAQLLNAI